MNTIAITFPKVKVNTEIKDLNFDNLENMIFEISQNIACKVFEKAITDIDDYLCNKRERGKLKNTGKKNTFLPVSMISSIPVPVTRTGIIKEVKLILEN